MIVQEPVQAAIWHCLNNYDYRDATFLAERLHSEVGTEESVFLLATCYYRAGEIYQAFWLLETKGVHSPQARYLMAKCAYDLNKFNEAETALCHDVVRTKNFDELCKEFGDVACFALQLLAKICYKTERINLANDANRKALKMNPFLWTSYTELCNRGDFPDPSNIFKIVNYDIFATCQSSNVNSMILIDYNNSSSYNTSNNINNNININNNGGDNNINLIKNFINNNDFDTTTPNNSINIIKSNNGGNIITGNLIEETPTNLNSGVDADCNNLSSSGTPYDRKKFKYLSAISPMTPSFGILPIGSPLDANMFSPNQQIQQQQQQVQQQQQQQQVQQQQTTLVEVNNEQKSIGKKLKGHVGSLINRKDSPLQQTKPIFSQTGNITPRTPNTLSGQNVRRSSRLFSNNNYSVKENNKSPIINKFATPRSPPRKSKQRHAKMNINNSTLNDMINEKQKNFDIKEKIETITSSNNSDNKVLINNCINGAQNMAQQILDMKKNSADGLMALMRDIGKGYLLLSQYECKEAIECFTNLPMQHNCSAWVQSMIAMGYYEQRDYNQASIVFQAVHEKEPYRLEYMDIYSTTLWHLQKEVLLSALAQDVINQTKVSPITWCIVGNCFSLQKEHDNAIKFFQRAIQVDPDFPYSYTLLGHELVLTEELDKALSCFRTALLKDSRHYNAWFGIGTIFSKQERYQLAEINYRRALKINPKNSVIMVHIAAMQYFLQKPEQALQTLNVAIQIDPKNPLCKFHRGSIYYQMGKHEEALTELEELKQIVPKESIVYYLIARIHKKLGNVDTALMHFSWAADLDPKGSANQLKDSFNDQTTNSAGTQNSNIDLSNKQESDGSNDDGNDDGDNSIVDGSNGDNEIIANVYDSDSY